MRKLIEKRALLIKVAIISLVIGAILSALALALVQWNIFELGHNVTVGDVTLGLGPGIQISAPYEA